MRSTRSFLIESSICRTPASLPLAQTLVATKSFDSTPSSAASWPVADSEEPYIGELSMTRPPSPTKVLRVSRACAVSAALPATSNTCQVPRPTAAIFSPVFGMERSRSFGESAAWPRGILPPKVSAAASLSQLRREMFMDGFYDAGFVEANQRIRP